MISLGISSPPDEAVGSRPSKPDDLPPTAIEKNKNQTKKNNKGHRRGEASSWLILSLTHQQMSYRPLHQSQKEDQRRRRMRPVVEMIDDHTNVVISPRTLPDDGTLPDDVDGSNQHDHSSSTRVTPVKVMVTQDLTGNDRNRSDRKSVAHHQQQRFRTNSSPRKDVVVQFHVALELPYPHPGPRNQLIGTVVVPAAP